MKRKTQIVSIVCACAALSPTCAFAAKISYFKGTSNEDLDAAIIQRLTKQGHTVTEFLPAGVEEADQLAEVKDKDLVIISETIGSVQVTDTQAAGGAFTLRTWPKPIISFEPYHWDEAFWTKATQFEEFGNSGRPEPTDEFLQKLQDTLYIKDPSHPLAAGLSGAVKVYKNPEKFSFNYGMPPASAKVVATVDQAGKYATIFEIPKGAKLLDNSTTPERRIGIFLAQGSGIVDDPPGTLLKFEYVSDQGLALFDAAVKFALSDGASGPPSAGPIAATHFTKVGNPGNAEDADTGFGKVGYEYYVGKFEITVGQYAEFLNAKAASDPHALYHENMEIDRAGTEGKYTYKVQAGKANKPIRWIVALQAFRFCNWLHNGATASADTEKGAYNFKDEETPGPRMAGAKFFLPTENEWYKAAYYDPTKGGKGGYWQYATKSDDVVAEAPPGGKNAVNFDAVVRDNGEVSDVGAMKNASSYYGTFDQTGNVWEWTEPSPDEPETSVRRSGSWENAIGRLDKTQTGRNPLNAGASQHQGMRIAAAAPSSGPVIVPATPGNYAETSNGELSADTAKPSSITLALGANTINGTMGKDAVAAGKVDADVVTFVVPAGQEITAINLAKYTVVSGSPKGGSFLAIASGTSINDTSAATHLSNIVVSAAGDLLTPLAASKKHGTVFGSASGPSTLKKPVPAGTYTLWFQEQDAKVDYSIVLTVAAASTPVDVGLVASWEFNTAVAGKEVTATVGGLKGTLEGNAKITADAGGRTGKAGDRSLDAGDEKDESALKVIDTKLINDAFATDTVTVAFWQKLDSVTDMTTIKFQSPESSGSERGFSVHTPWSNRTIYFDTAGCCDAGTQRINKAVAANFVFEDWHHYAFVKDKRTKRIYVDGNLFHSGTNTSPLPVDISVWWIGAGFDNGADAAESMDGFLDDVALFKTALSIDTIKKLAGGAKPSELGGSTPPPPSEPLPIIRSVTRTAAANGLAFAGRAGKSYDVQFSEDLKTWTTVASNLTGAVNYQDTDAARRGKRTAFYRAQQK